MSQIDFFMIIFLCWNWLWYLRLKKKKFISDGGSLILVRHFNGREFLLSTLLLVRLVRSFFFSSINCLLYSVHRVCLEAYFYATKICIWCRPSLYIFHSLRFYIFSIFTIIEFKVSLLISLLYMPNKVFPSFCWNLHLTLVHCPNFKWF